MAQALAAALQNIETTELMYPVEANVVFAKIPETIQAALREREWSFYTFLPPLGCRLMCAWDTDEDTIAAFAADLKAITA